MVFPAALAILAGCYTIVLIWVTLGLYRIPKNQSEQLYFVSVVVAARNEQEHIPALLHALTRQDYPQEKYEIIIVDDASEDSTAELVNSFQEPRVRLLQSQDRHLVLSPKKHAIQTGVNLARGDIILLTDADCLPPSGWISGMVSLFTPNVGMVIGFSPAELPQVRRLGEYFLAIDSLALAAVAAGTSGWGYAATCNGRNLAYRKQVYNEVGGFSRINHFVSGDDDLMLKLVQKTQWSIRYAYDASLSVPTQHVQSVRQFTHQRLRHASKGFFYEYKKIAALVLVYLYNLLIFLSVPFALLSWIPWSMVLFFTALKFIFEFILLFRFAFRLHRLYFLRIFPLAELLHVPYVVIFGALGPFKKFKWKDS